ncbi:transposase [Streptomyces sp. NPDC003023]|uniref:transposase n=1 Tax=Streptomyces sp. NPDC003023 TaxID=3364675 RepID=UPI0036790B8C
MGYALELRNYAVQRYRQANPKPTYGSLADELGVHPDTVRRWVRLAEQGTRNTALNGNARRPDSSPGASSPYPRNPWSASCSARRTDWGAHCDASPS